MKRGRWIFKRGTFHEFGEEKEVKVDKNTKTLSSKLKKIIFDDKQNGFKVTLDYYYSPNGEVYKELCINGNCSSSFI